MSSFNEGLFKIIQDAPSFSSEEMATAITKLLQIVVILNRQRNGLCDYKTQIDDFDEEIEIKVFQDN